MDALFTASFGNKAVPDHACSPLSSSGIPLFSPHCFLAGTSPSPLPVLLALSPIMADSSSPQNAPALLAEMSDPASLA